MKFYTLVLLPENTHDMDDKSIEEYVAAQMKPFKMVDDDGLPYNKEWKWDYYCLYDKAYMSKMGFSEPLYKDIEPKSEYVVYATEALTIEHMSFAILTPDGQWLNGPYPLQDPDPLWPEKALEKIKNSGALFGVYVYCHS